MMTMLANVLVGVVAALHAYFLVLEMFLWDTPTGRRVFRLTPEFSKQSKALAMNQGLYNGFLFAGLVWGLAAGVDGFAIKVFFLSCVTLAGVVGAATVHPRVFWIQSGPAIAALGLLLSARS